MTAVVNPLRDIRNGGDVGCKGAGADCGHQPKEKCGDNGDGAFPHRPEKLQEIHVRKDPRSGAVDNTREICLVFLFIPGQVPDVHILLPVKPVGIVNPKPE